MTRIFVFLLLLLPVFSAHGADVRIAFIEYDCSRTVSVLAKTALESHGYTVELIPLNETAMWHALARGDVDGSFSIWLPKTQGSYRARYQDRVVDLGPHVTGARIGWAIPNYLPYTSINDLKGQENLFGNVLVGIDPTDGMMPLSQKAIVEYGLDLEIVPGSGRTVVAALEHAIEAGDPILFTAWSPHWMFRRWGLRYLDDPLDTLSQNESIHTVVRQGLKESQPEIFSFFSLFRFTGPAQLEELMDRNAGPQADMVANSRLFLDENSDQVKGWFKTKTTR